jgi:hypothetical protein
MLPKDALYNKFTRYTIYLPNEISLFKLFNKKYTMLLVIKPAELRSEIPNRTKVNSKKGKLA